MVFFWYLHFCNFSETNRQIEGIRTTVEEALSDLQDINPEKREDETTKLKFKIVVKLTKKINSKII